MINTTNINQARKEIQKLKKENKLAIVQAQDPEFNRKILEINETDILLSPELHSRKDKLKQRDSGLNEILCKIAAKNNIAIGINLREISKLDPLTKSKTLARIKQNIQLCKRTKTKIIIYPENQNKQEITSFLTTLGASTTQIPKFSAN